MKARPRSSTCSSAPVVVTPSCDCDEWEFLGYWDASTNLFPVNPSRNGYYKASSSSSTLLGIDGGIYPAGTNINYIGDDPTDIYSWDAVYASDNHPVIPEIDTLEINL